MKKFFLLICFFLIISCGKKTPPFPIEKSIPEDFTFEIEVTYSGFNLWINLPRETKGGYPLNKIKALIIEREEIPLESFSKPRIKIIKIKPNLHSAGNLYLYADHSLQPNFAYKYRLKIEKDFLVKTPFTREKIVFWTIPPMPPSNLRLQTTNENLILLTWDPPLLNLNKEPLKGKIFYRLERITKEERKWVEITENSFKEKIPQGEVCYRLKTLLNFYETLIPSPFSELICYP